MIYICADDYGLCGAASEKIQHCINHNALDKVSFFPNYDSEWSETVLKNCSIEKSLHINLVEGKCLSQPSKISLLADENGRFKHTFIGLFKLSLLKPKELSRQLYQEIKAQIIHWKTLTLEESTISVDSHQHTHMIPLIFKVLLEVLRDESITVRHLRIPAEPILPFLLTPSLYLTYRPINLIKQWLLKFFWQINKHHFKGLQLSRKYFFGILFSGKMDEKRVRKVLPHYIKLAERNKMDIEVSFHPGYLLKEDINQEKADVVFESFYLSKDRKIEYDAVLSLKNNNIMKEVCNHAIH